MNIILAVFLILTASNIKAQEDNVLKAVSDEVNRTAAKLKIEKSSAPYFASCYVADSSETYISASFGEIKESKSYFNRNGRFEVRIGNEMFDSSHYISNFRDYRPVFRNLPVEDDYDSIRKSLWLMADEAYKIAVERYSQKEAYRKKKDIKEIYGDLSIEKPNRYFEKNSSCGNLDKQRWEKRLKNISQLFRKYPNISDSDINARFSSVTRRFSDSQGFSYKTYSCEAYVSIFVYMQNEEGYKLKDNKDFLYASWKEAEEDNIEAKAEEYAKSLNDSYKAEKIDYYVGPALFTQEAAAEFLNQLFVRNISFNPKPWADKDEWLKYYYEIPKLKDRIGKRILPGFIWVYDDAKAKEYEGRKLAGYYEIDSEGIAPLKLELVKKGKLETIYASRNPDEKIRNSNGRGRASYNFFPYATAANVFFMSDKKLDSPSVKEKLISLGKEQELDYVLVVKKIASYKDSESNLGNPILAYKLDLKTGKETPLNISEFEGIGLRALRDIEAVSSKNQVYNFYQRGPYSYSASAVPTSIICPQDILIREIEIKKTQDKPEKKPYLKHPYFTK
ncbi:MAG: hypothetical protein GX447_08145 [Elusimicrobia bacterium]|nr:hypothetical protein [Elusimicrobiota bacterium]